MIGGMCIFERSGSVLKKGNGSNGNIKKEREEKVWAQEKLEVIVRWVHLRKNTDCHQEQLEMRMGEILVRIKKLEQYVKKKRRNNNYRRSTCFLKKILNLKKFQLKLARS